MKVEFHLHLFNSFSHNSKPEQHLREKLKGREKVTTKSLKIQPVCRLSHNTSKRYKPVTKYVKKHSTTIVQEAMDYLSGWRWWKIRLKTTFLFLHWLIAKESNCFHNKLKGDSIQLAISWWYFVPKWWVVAIREAKASLSIFLLMTILQWQWMGGRGQTKQSGYSRRPAPLLFPLMKDSFLQRKDPLLIEQIHRIQPSYFEFASALGQSTMYCHVNV